MDDVGAPIVVVDDAVAADGTVAVLAKTWLDGVDACDVPVTDK